ncbi:MAG TPA: magnesium transporter CorA family protein [Alphaproteobacteria bacterium]|nr:magnesium transporter CorA family protein [Alphaproteobacteria bacterium]
MITVYSHRAGAVSTEAFMHGEPLPQGVIWIDALRPTEEERAALSAAVGIDLPTQADMHEIEASSRIYDEEGTSFLTAPIVAKADTPTPEVGALTFVLTPDLLITQRFVEPKSIEVFADLIRRQPKLCDSAAETLIVLLETIVDRSADVLELVGGRLDALSRRVFGETEGARAGRRAEGELQAVLRGVGLAGDLLSKIRDSLAGLDRIIAYIGAQAADREARDVKMRIEVIQRDLRSLAEHAGFQAQRVGFLLNATLGVISVEQNTVVKSFTVAATVFFPPTLIASIYGMNFDVMPELHWAFGYPAALGLMALSAVLPLWYFRRRGWF